jgi:hypothetical protein
MADWAGAYGAGGAAQALEQIVARQFLERKQAEIERAQRVQEAQAQAEMAQRAEQSRQGLALQYANLAADRDENYQNRTQHVTDTNVRMQRQTLEDQMKAGERTGDAAREDARIKARYEHDDARDAKNRAFQLYLAGQRGGGGASPKDQIELERARLQLEAEKQKQAGAGQERERQTAQSQESTQAAFDSVNRLLDPKGVGAGLDSSYGNWEMRKGRTQASSDFQAERDRFVAMLSLPNLGSLKGPMSDKDLLFIKQISSTLSNDNISEKAARQEMERARNWLIEKGANPGGSGGGLVSMVTPDGRSINVPAAQVAEAEKRGAKRR